MEVKLIQIYEIKLSSSLVLPPSSFLCCLSFLDGEACLTYLLLMVVTCGYIY